MNNYQQLVARFGEVRRSWKRAAALSGLAIVVTESIGLLTVLLLVDWLYQPQPLVRMGMWVAALGGIGWFLLRQVVAPLMRKIPDEQIALYIEEHRQELDGILITAAEYGGKHDHLGRDQAALIDAVVREAAARAHTSAKRVVDFSRLKKYGAVALWGIALYVLLVFLFPQAVGHHVGRVVKPWNATIEDVAGRGPGAMLLEPIRFNFSTGDTTLARGSTFEFEAMLSRTADKPVVLNFRPRMAGAQWQTLPMKELEKLNVFQGTLADVSEDLEFQVACGLDKSEVHRIAVYDPLVVQSLEVTTHYPAYTKLPDRVESSSSGDIEALVDATVTVRFLASTPLKDGTIKWGSGRTQKLTVDPKANTMATMAFDVKADDTYDYTLADINGQQAASGASLSLKAVIDTPPTLKVEWPKSPVFTNPLGEIVFDATADDDIGVEKVDLVYSRLDANGEPHETRVPLMLAQGDTKLSPNIVRATGRLALEDAQPPFKPEEGISFHLEACDGKGQKALSEIGLIIIGYFDSWATWDIPPDGSSQPDDGPDLLAMLEAVWHLDSVKATLSPADLQTQSKQMADLMTDKSGGLRDFVQLRLYPQLAKVAAKITLHAGNAREALCAADTEKAAIELRTAAVIAAGGKLLEINAMEVGGATTSSSLEEPKLTMLEKARIDAQAAASETTRTEKEKEDTKNAEETAKSLETLISKQDKVLAQAKSQTSPESDAKLATEQKALADKTKELAHKTKPASPLPTETGLQHAAEKTAEAAKAMGEAAADFAADRKPEAEAKATTARKLLQEAQESVGDMSREKLAEAISQTESRASALAESQQEVQKKSEAIGKEMGTKTEPDQGQTRDLKELALSQTKLHGATEALDKQIEELSKRAESVKKPEVARALTEAVRAIKRSQPEQKMANAIVDLNKAAPAAAAEEQKGAQEALRKVAESLRNGDDALAASREARIAQATRNAEGAKKALAELSGTEGAKAVPKANGAQEDAAKAAAAKLNHDLQRLAAGLDKRDLVSQKDVDRIKEISNGDAELKKDLVADPKLIKEVNVIVIRISNKLEAQTVAKTEASKLFSSQREECPPGYRQFVNQYFEALSRVSRKPEGAQKQ